MQCGVALSPKLLKRPVQFDCFRAARFDYQMYFNTPNNQVDLHAVMRGGGEIEKLALDEFMQRLFTSLLEQVRNYR